MTGARVELPMDYSPSSEEEFMNPLQLEYFRQRLLTWKKQILNESEATLNVLQIEPLREPDLNDRASNEAGWSIELRARDRQRKLIAKIDAALRRTTANMAIARSPASRSRFGGLTPARSRR